MTPILDTANVLFSSPARFHTMLLVVSVLYRLSSYIRFVSTPTEPIPLNVVNFLSAAVLQHSEDPRTEIQRLWGLVSEDSEDWKGLLLNLAVDELLRESGPTHELGAEMLCPPYTTHRHIRPPRLPTDEHFSSTMTCSRIHVRR
uniref:Uncharacterized protein n=1 Tax=Mycena chlorophos TaxID=658473 RepID=A0ABQ0M565_MYCCL|nr:predicted protein [Mycena chlorophos]